MFNLRIIFAMTKEQRRSCFALITTFWYVVQLDNFTVLLYFKIPLSLGDPKTLTPGPRTPTTDRVRGLPTDRSTDYPYGPLYGPPAK